MCVLSTACHGPGENAVPKMWSNHKASGVVFQEFPMTTAERGADRRSTESTGEVWRVGGLIVAALPVQRVFHPRLLCHLPMCEARVWGHSYADSIGLGGV